MAVSVVCGVRAQSQPMVPLKAELVGVTLFRDQAELSFEASAAVTPGANVLVARGIPSDVNRNTIRLQVTGAGVLLGFELSPDTPDTTTVARQVAPLRDSLARLRRLKARAEALLRVNGQERTIYLDNATLDRARVTPEAVRLMASTTRARLEALEAERGGLEADLDQLRRRQRSFTARIDSLRNMPQRPTQQLSIAFSATAAGPIGLRCSYLSPSARWAPEYVLDVPAVGPGRLSLLARVSNQTGIDWQRQRLSFSTANPGRSSTPPEEKRRTLPPTKTEILRSNSSAGSYTEIARAPDAEEGFIVGLVVDQEGNALAGASISVMMRSTGRVLSGVYSDGSGRFRLKYPDAAAQEVSLRISYISYATLEIPGVKSGGNYSVRLSESSTEVDEVVVNTAAARRRAARAEREERDDAQSAHEFVRLEEADLFRVYQLEQPVTLKGEGGSQTLSLASYALPLTRRHRAAPADDPDAFLVGEVRGWQALGLVSGLMRVTYEGSFVGQSRIDARELADTVEVGLGRDSRVLVRRERDRQFTQRQFIGDRVRDRRAYSLSVRNARRDSVELVLRDYVPVSLRDDISVELLEASGAEHQRERGVLTWRLMLAPGESRELRFGYELRYPRSRYTIPLD